MGYTGANGGVPGCNKHGASLPPAGGRGAFASSLAVATVLLSCALGGCQVAPSTGASALAPAVDPVALSRDLRLQLDNHLAQVIGTASEIAAAVPDRRVRENCLRWKMRTYNSYASILAEVEEDPRRAFLSEWIAAVGLRLYLTSEEGKNLFGTQQSAAVAVASRVEAEVVSLGKRHFPVKAIDDAEDDIEKSARNYSPVDVFGTRSAATAAPLDADLLSILHLPLLPVRTLEGASSTPKAIDRFTDAARDFAAIVRHLPEQSRWEAELLLLEMESTGPAAALDKQIDRLEKILRESTATLKSIPAEMRQEFEKSLAAVEKAQPGVTGALTEARGAAEEVRKAAEQSALAAKSFESAAAEVRALLADYKQMSQPGAEPVSKKAETGPEDYRAMADSIAAAAKETRSLLAELQQPVPKEGGIRQAADEFGRLIDSLFWKALLLVLAVFILAGVYRWSGRRKPRPGTN
jgi:hypothetical protein